MSHSSVLQCMVVFCSVLQCVAVYGSILQCIAVCCSALSDMSHVWMSYVMGHFTPVNESSLMSHIWMSYVVCDSWLNSFIYATHLTTHCNTLQHTATYMWISRQLCRTYEWVVSFVRTSCVTRVKRAVRWACCSTNTATGMSHVTQMSASCHENDESETRKKETRGGCRWGDDWRAVCSSVLQCVAVCCSALQRVVVCCSVLWCVAVCCGALQCVAVCCSVSQGVTVCGSAWQCVAVCCRVLQCVLYVAGCCSALHYVAVCCSVLQCGAVCRNVLQGVAV